jgi:hypothetical protein
VVDSHVVLELARREWVGFDYEDEDEEAEEERMLV